MSKHSGMMSLERCCSRPEVVPSEVLDIVYEGEVQNLFSKHCFVPIAVETSGSLGEDASHYIHQLGRCIAEMTGDGRVTAFLLHCLRVIFKVATRRM